MSEPKFTKGPWRVADIDTASGQMDIKAGEFFIAGVINGLPKEEWEANAHLISAAPDLYEALIEARACLISFTEGATDYTVAKIDAALAKADGGGE